MGSSSLPSPMATTTNNNNKPLTTKDVVVVAGCSRLLVVLLCVLADYLVEDYDTSSSLADPYDSPLHFFLSPFVKWDAVYFTRIAQFGYEYEQFFAFFPLLPFLTRVLRFSLFFWVEIEDIAYALSGIFVTNISFIGSAVAFYYLSLVVTKSTKISKAAFLLYCFNPASIFLSAAYTESLYAFCLYLGLLSLEKNHLITAILSFTLAASTRSTAVLFSLFLLFPLLPPLFPFLSPSPSHSGKGGGWGGWERWGREVVQRGVGVVVVIVPSVLYQYYAYFLLCEEDPSPWCFSFFPSVYSYVQSHYWGVGPFKYYECKQIPNFLLAAPVLCLSLISLWDFFSTFFLKRTPFVSLSHHKPLLIYMFYWLLLTGVLVVISHVQISTRVLTASPALYWYCASFWLERNNSNNKNHNKNRNNNNDNNNNNTNNNNNNNNNNKEKWGIVKVVGEIVPIFFVSYLCLGVILHSNFYPWT